MTAIIITVILLIFIVAALTDLVLLMRHSTLPGALAPAFALFVATESILLNFLSMFHAVNYTWLLWVHVVLVTLWLIYAVRNRRMIPLWKKYVRLQRIFWGNHAVQLMIPLLILVGIAAVMYPPNTYDVLTYHMARVVHWLQNGSVSYYPTANERQNVMGPGAEYLLLLVQSLSDSDILANLFQFVAFLVLIISILHLLRLFKVQRGLAGWIMILTATAPIAIMEASNPKNDLVAAVMAFAVLFSSIRIILGHVNKIPLREYALLGVCLASAFLVKPTALLAALPVVVIGGCRQVPLLFSKAVLRDIARGIVVVFLVMLLIAGADIVRKQQDGVPRHEVYPLFHEYTVDRLWNPLRHFAHNTPYPRRTVALARDFGYQGDLITKDVFNFQEDMVGNPFQGALFVFMAFLSIFLWFVRPHKLRYVFLLCVSLSPIVAWFVFGMVIRDQAWITRLQIPLLFLLPLSFIYISTFFYHRRNLELVLTIPLAVISLGSLSYAALVATHVPPRPLVLSYFWGERPGRIGAYYTRIASLKAEHEFFLNYTRQIGCKRIGLILGGDSVDYPLTWRAVQQGDQVRYLREQVPENDGYVWRFREEDADWPCIMYASYGVPEHVPDRGRQYLSAGDYHTYVRNFAWEFDQSQKTVLLLHSSESWKEIISLNDIDTIEKYGQGVRIVSRGKDPQLLLPLFSSERARSAIMQLTFVSPVDTEVQLYYMTGKMPYYTEQNSIRMKCKKGINELYFFLPVNDIIGAVRLDPGKQSGMYYIRKIEIRTINRSVPGSNEKEME